MYTMTTDRSSTSADYAYEEGRSERRPDAEIDVKLLAEKVYRLMLADLRLAQARGERPTRRRERR
jgi:hypothetical protein